MSDYVSHPDRVGNALDLGRPVRNQAFTYIDERHIGIRGRGGPGLLNGRIISGVFASPWCAVPSATELSDLHWRSPAALATIVARERQSFYSMSGQQGQCWRPASSWQTLAEGRINADASAGPWDAIGTLSDMRVAGDISCNRSITVGGVSGSTGDRNGGGTEIRAGAVSTP
jgi:hypothetical protein